MLAVADCAGTLDDAADDVSLAVADSEMVGDCAGETADGALVELDTLVATGRLAAGGAAPQAVKRTVVMPTIPIQKSIVRMMVLLIREMPLCGEWV
jgi:hypothetical protein